MRPKLEERPNSQISILAEMAIEASKEAMNQAEVDASDLNAVICGCSNLQRAYPAIAIEIQEELAIETIELEMQEVEVKQVELEMFKELFVENFKAILEEENLVEEFEEI